MERSPPKLGPTRNEKAQLAAVTCPALMTQLAGWGLRAERMEDSRPVPKEHLGLEQAF